GRYHFTYTITDKDGVPSAPGHGVVTVTPVIAHDGHYDDDSFYVAYDILPGAANGWTPSYSVSAAFNHTLHSSKQINNTLVFHFTGTVASLNMLGSNIGNMATNKLKVEFNLDVATATDPPTYMTYADAKLAIPTLTCVNTLTNTAPDASSNISNFSA